MNPINHFLRDKITDETTNIEFRINQNDCEFLNELFKERPVKYRIQDQHKINPKISKNQLWTIKDKYEDHLAHKIILPHIYLVLIQSEILESEGECFVRVQKISPFIEMATNTDLIVWDRSILGFPFLIEKWNEQPILTKLLDVFLGEISIEEDINKLDRKEEYSSEILSFREIELMNSRYLNHSILALMSHRELVTEEHLEEIILSENESKVHASGNVHYDVIEKNEIASRKNQSKVRTLTYFKSLSIAASIILILTIWQPQHSSNEELFTDYVTNIDKITAYSFESPIIKNEGTRSDNLSFKNFSDQDSKLIWTAINEINASNFNQANAILTELNIDVSKNPGLALYLAIAKINSNESDKGIVILKKLDSLSNFEYKDDVKYHLAFAYIKIGDRKNAKILLNELTRTDNRFKNDATTALRKIRWF